MNYRKALKEVTGLQMVCIPLQWGINISNNSGSKRLRLWHKRKRSLFSKKSTEGEFGLPQSDYDEKRM